MKKPGSVKTKKKPEPGKNYFNNNLTDGRAERKRFFDLPLKMDI